MDDRTSFKEMLASEHNALEEEIKKINNNIIISNKNNEFDKVIDLKEMLLGIEKEYDLTDPLEINKAIEILGKEDPLQYFMDYIQLKHTGDLVLAKILFLAIANQSISNSKGIQPHLGGRSGTGKTNLVNAVMDTIPELAYKKTGSLSSKNLYYQKNLPDGLIFFCDDIRMNDDLEDTLKQSMTNFQTNTKHSTIISGEACTLVLPKRILWLLTSVDVGGSDELRNRLYDVTVDESSTQDEEVAKMQLEAAGHIKKYENINERLTTCQTIIYIIKKQLFEVDIPYHNRIRASKHITKDRRRLPRFIDMIKGFALLNFMQREINEKGHLIATIEDFNAAKELFEANIESQVTNLTRAELRLAKWMFDQAKSVSINNIVEGYFKPNGEQFNPESIRKVLQGTKTHEGLIAKLPGLLVDDSNREVRYYLPHLDIYGGELITLVEENATIETPALFQTCANPEKQKQEA